MVTVYTIPACPQCDTTKRFLERADISYTVIDMSKDAEAHDFVKGLGYTQAPVVSFEGKHWSGFRFEELNALKAHFA